MNNNIYLIISIFLMSKLGAQVAIGKSGLSKLADSVTVNPSISLEFYDGEDNAKGLVLPWVSTVANSPTVYDAITGEGYNGLQGNLSDGTIIFDLSDKKIKYRKPGEWFDLTGEPTFPLTVKNELNNNIVITAFDSVDSTLQDNMQEQETAKVAIGSNASDDHTVGILVLTDTDKAMVLPKVASPHLAIQNPAAGMMVYDTTKKQLAVYNGTLWSFWKP
ncbi:hypothetical protein PQ459_07065 [Chryseobacterium sp. KACC 21268]|nr:hypothetical protein PQ459_07065 [Chryseobacterium sp. KACC 21268]